MSQRETNRQNPIKIIVGVLAFILLVVWFYFEREFEPLVGILIALEASLLWVAKKSDKGL